MKIRNIVEQKKLDEIDLVPSGIRRTVGGLRDRMAARQLKKQTSQATTAVAQNVRAASNAALQQWNNKVALLSQASGGTVDPTEYENHLADFVERVMLRSYKLADLDPQSQQRVESAIGAVMQNKDDPRSLAAAFEKLVQQTMVARLDPEKTAFQSPAAQKTVGPGAKNAPGVAQPAPSAAMTSAEAAKAVSSVLRASRVNQQVLAANVQKILGPVEVQRTNNDTVNALLQSLGIQVK